MKRFNLRFFLTSTLLILASSAHAAGGESGNGGGVIRAADGHWTTFYSAGFYTDSVEALPEEVPQLKNLENFLLRSPYLSNGTIARFVDNLIPSDSRHYYRVQADRFTSDVRARLIQAYVDALNKNLPAGTPPVDPTRITPAAVTDPSTGNTYLLPEFYDLKTDAQKMAILYHEDYWMVHPKASYEDVVASEIAFQAFLEDQQSASRLFSWLKSAHLGAELWAAALKTDLAQHSMDGLIKKSGNDSIILLKDLYPLYSNCTADCDGMIKIDLYNLTQQYPKSLFLRMFYAAYTTGAMNVYDNDFTGRHYSTYWIVVDSPSQYNAPAVVQGHLILKQVRDRNDCGSNRSFCEPIQLEPLKQ